MRGTSATPSCLPRRQGRWHVGAPWYLCPELRPDRPELGGRLLGPRETDWESFRFKCNYLFVIKRHPCKPLGPPGIQGTEGVPGRDTETRNDVFEE